jgi:DNA mismatch repair protein MutL
LITTSDGADTIERNREIQPGQPPLEQVIKIPLLRPIGQLGRTYIAAEGPDGLYLIDQHAAHERILYEKFINQSENDKSAQLLLEPVVIDFPSSYLEKFEQQQKVLSEIGFQFEQFGPGVYKLTSVPPVMINVDPKEALFNIFDDKGNSADQKMNIVNKDAIIKNICKRIAIKGGQVLSGEEQKQLIRDLENCKNPRTCPHGRPTMIHISVDVLERQFGRKGSI